MYIHSYSGVKSVDPEFRVLSVLYSFWIFKVVYVDSVFVISWSYKLF